MSSWRIAWLVFLTGCSSTGGLFGTTPRHQMLPETEMVATAQPGAAPLPRELDKRVSPPYVVEPGDVLLIQPADLDSPVRLPGDQPILPDGTIQLGKYGRLQVAGRTLDEIEAAVKNIVNAQTKDAGVITARVVTRQSKVYYVLGEVNSPGSFTFTGRETVLDAIQIAGGLTDKAAHKKIVLSRPSAGRLPKGAADLLRRDRPARRHVNELPDGSRRPNLRRFQGVLR